MTAIEFKRMVEREAKPLRQYAYQLTRNVEDTNDLVQETMLKALVYRNYYTPQTNFKAWVFTIMRNVFINQYITWMQIKMNYMMYQ